MVVEVAVVGGGGDEGDGACMDKLHHIISHPLRYYIASHHTRIASHCITPLPTTLSHRALSPCPLTAPSHRALSPRPLTAPSHHTWNRRAHSRRSTGWSQSATRHGPASTAAVRRVRTVAAWRRALGEIYMLLQYSKGLVYTGK